ncbi:hypothetical protein Bhyg_15371 [Pseudolycoriella hygida]|uniref:PHD-type domain-containing protein n=1 Tax=Pseudolycoriella hygida TaxID=35572 RepID=A0A9Q0RY64_9DIPT|nr:hypothetical protein Bhyg_15371 [Pseudolycoriella hygida]
MAVLKMLSDFRGTEPNGDRPRLYARNTKIFTLYIQTFPNLFVLLDGQETKNIMNNLVSIENAIFKTSLLHSTIYLLHYLATTIGKIQRGKYNEKEECGRIEKRKLEILEMDVENKTKEFRIFRLFIEKDFCRKCEKKFKDNEERVFCLGPCHKNFHAKCFGFTPTVLKFYRESNNLSFECDDCQNDPTKMVNKTLDKILSFMNIFNERLNRQEIKSEMISEQIVELNSNVQKSEIEIIAELNKETVEGRNVYYKPYTEIVKEPVKPVLIVRPRKLQKCADTREDVNNKIIPSKIQLCSDLQLSCKIL